MDIQTSEQLKEYRVHECKQEIAKLDEQIARRSEAINQEIVTLNYLLEIERGTTGYSYITWYSKGVRIECEVRINPDTHEIIEVLTAQKITFDNRAFPKDGEKSSSKIIFKEEYPLKQVDKKQLAETLRIQKEKIIPIFQKAKEKYEELLKILEESTFYTDKILLDKNNKFMIRPFMSKTYTDAYNIETGDGEILFFGENDLRILGGTVCSSRYTEEIKNAHKNQTPVDIMADITKIAQMQSWEKIEAITLGIMEQYMDNNMEIPGKTEGEEHDY